MNISCTLAINSKELTFGPNSTAFSGCRTKRNCKWVATAGQYPIAPCASLLRWLDWSMPNDSYKFVAISAHVFSSNTRLDSEAFILDQFVRCTVESRNLVMGSIPRICPSVSCVKHSSTIPLPIGTSFSSRNCFLPPCHHFLNNAPLVLFKSCLEQWKMLIVLDVSYGFVCSTISVGSHSLSCKPSFAGDTSLNQH